MRDDGRRRPGAVPDEAVDATGPDGAVDVRWGTDTDGDGHPDTLLTADGADLLVLTDLDGDGLADRALRIGPDAAVHVDRAPHPEVAHPDVAHPDVVPGPWAVLLGPLLRPDT